MLHIKELIVVEGKYDKEKLKKVTDAPIVCTNGFDLYRSKSVISSIRKLSEDRGIIILTDSDGAGFRIRAYLKNCLGKNCSIKNAYIPAVKGKEHRKDKPGKEGLLGVEGMSEAVLEDILSKVSSNSCSDSYVSVSKADFYALGLSGKPDSSKMRDKLAKKMGLPPRLSANGLLELINQTGGRELLDKYISTQKVSK